jgi:hypothetical protein
MDEAAQQIAAVLARLNNSVCTYRRRALCNSNDTEKIIASPAGSVGWHGKGDPQLNFIIPMNSWLQHHGIQDSSTSIPFLLHNLPPLLQLRYHKLAKEATRAGTETPQNAEQFYELVKEWVPTPNRLREARETLQRVRHFKGKIYQYNNLFSSLAMEVGDDMSRFDLNWLYVHGLQPEVMKEVDMNITLHTTPLSEVMAKAASTESRLRDLATIMGPASPRPYHHPAISVRPAVAEHSAPASSDPMELGMIRRNRAGRPLKQPFHGNCFKCGKPGHRKEDCRIQQPPTRRRR